MPVSSVAKSQQRHHVALQQYKLTERLQRPPVAHLQVASDAIAAKLRVASGALLAGVEPGGAAAAAGLLATRRGLGGVLTGDVIAAVDGRPVLSGGDLLNALEAYEVGRRVTLDVLRTLEQARHGTQYCVHNKHTA